MSEAVRKYRPSNGTEGEGFISLWCRRCSREQWLRTHRDTDKKCDILNRTVMYNINHPEYPQEWQEGADGPVCTAFKPRGGPVTQIGRLRALKAWQKRRALRAVADFFDEQ